MRRHNYHPDVAVHYSSTVDDGVVAGAALVDGQWVNPDFPSSEIVESAQPGITVSPVEFKLLWTSAERIAAKDLQTTDAIIADFFEILNDSRLTFVNLSLGSTQDGVDYLLSKLVERGVVADEDVPARRAAILSGQFV
jgi:hypothetical protein